MSRIPWTARTSIQQQRSIYRASNWSSQQECQESVVPEKQGDLSSTETAVDLKEWLSRLRNLEAKVNQRADGPEAYRKLLQDLASYPHDDDSGRVASSNLVSLNDLRRCRADRSPHNLDEDELPPLSPLSLL